MDDYDIDPEAKIYMLHERQREIAKGEKEEEKEEQGWGRGGNCNYLEKNGVCGVLLAVKHWMSGTEGDVESWETRNKRIHWRWGCNSEWSMEEEGTGDNPGEAVLGLADLVLGCLAWR